jgi:hypothetical protein
MMPKIKMAEEKALRLMRVEFTIKVINNKEGRDYSLGYPCIDIK